MDEALLKKQILATVVYYNELDYPLTAFEVWRHRISLATAARNAPQVAAGEHDSQAQSATLWEVTNILESAEMKKWIESDRGFYFLRGQKKMVKTRIRRNKLSVAKLKRLRRAAFWMRLIPYVRMIGVTGRLAMKNAERGSDWDVLVVLKKGKIWTGRTLVTLFSEIIGKRRKGTKIKDRICLNYFITEGSLEIKNKDLFSAHEYFFIRPLWGEKTFRAFRVANEWIRDYKPNFQPVEILNLKNLPDNKFFSLLQKIGEIIFDWEGFEKYLGKIERKKIQANPLTHREGSLVSATDEALIFLPAPQGSKVFESFKLRIEKLVVNNRSAF